LIYFDCSLLHTELKQRLSSTPTPSAKPSSPSKTTTTIPPTQTTTPTATTTTNTGGQGSDFVSMTTDQLTLRGDQYLLELRQNSSALKRTLDLLARNPPVSSAVPEDRDADSVFP
jgi:hypothetical protein